MSDLAGYFRKAILRKKASLARIQAILTNMQAVTTTQGREIPQPLLQQLEEQRVHEIAVLAELEQGLLGLLSKSGGATPRTAPFFVGFTWKELEARFRQLQSEMGVDDLLPFHETVEWEDGAVTDNWGLLGGNSMTKQRFTALASAAARKLGFTVRVEAEDYWLDRLEDWNTATFQQREGPPGSTVEWGRTGKTHAFTIKRVAELSADYCLELISRGTPEAVNSAQLPAPDDGDDAQIFTSGAARLGTRRAKLVETLIKELNVLRPLLQVPEDDFPRLQKEYPNYETFKICKAYPSASKWVKLAPDRPRVHKLAYEIAANHFGVASSTIESDWKRYKPRSRKTGKN